MWQVLWLSPSPEQARPYVEASELQLQDVGFLGTSSKSREEIEKFQREAVALNFNQSFSKIHILS